MGKGSFLANSINTINTISTISMRFKERFKERFNTRSNALADAFRKEKGLGTVEIVIIIAVLIGIALIFRDAIISFVERIMSTVFGDESIINDISSDSIRNGQ